MDTLELTRIGLNQNEATVYLALLQAGRTSAGELIKRTQFHRNIVYDNIEKLIDKGLVMYIQEIKHKVFACTAPEFLTEYLEKEQKKLDEKKEIVSKLLQEIPKYLNQESESEAMILRGNNGIRIVMNEILKEKTDYIAYGAPPISNDIMGKHYWQQISNTQKRNKIKCRMIFNSSMSDWARKVSHNFIDIRILKGVAEPLTETIVYSNNTAIIIWTNKPIVTLIRDKNVAYSNKLFFEILWKSAKKAN